MSLTSVQSQIVEDSAAEYIANYDRIIQSYLNVRQDIFKAHAAGITDDDRDRLRKDLAICRLQFQSHIEGLIRLIDYQNRVCEPDHNPDLQSYHQQVARQRQQLDETSATVEKQLHELSTIHKPMLLSLREVVNDFERNSSRPGSKSFQQYLVTDNTFSKQQLVDLFGDDHLQSLAGQLLSSGSLSGLLKYDDKSDIFTYDSRASLDHPLQMKRDFEDICANINRTVADTTACQQQWQKNASELMSVDIEKFSVPEVVESVAAPPSGPSASNDDDRSHKKRFGRKKGRR